MNIVPAPARQFFFPMQHEDLVINSFSIKMSYQNKRVVLQVPKSYEELRQNRTKKNKYNYTANQTKMLQLIDLPLSIHNDIGKQVSFQGQFLAESKSRASKQQIGVSEQSPTKNKLTNEKINFIDQFTFDVETKVRRKQQKLDQIQEVNTFVKNDSKQNHEKQIFKPTRSITQESILNKVSINQKSIQFQNQFSRENSKEQVQNQKIQSSAFQTSGASLVRAPKHNHQGSAVLPSKPSRKVQYYYGEKQLDKEKIKQEVELKYQRIVKKEIFLNKNSQLDLQIAKIKHKILDNSPLMLPVGITQDLFHKEKPYCIIQNQQVQKMTNKLCQLIELDMKTLEKRQAFELCNQEDKCKRLKNQLESNNIAIQQGELNQIFSVSIHQRNPFSSKKIEFSSQCTKQLAKLHSQSELLWQQLQKSFSLEKLYQQECSVSLMDLKNKGILMLEDLVCFVNVNKQTFFRSRDLVPLFRRFLKLQGKKVERLIGLCNIAYKTFIQKLAK